MKKILLIVLLCYVTIPTIKAQLSCTSKFNGAYWQDTVSVGTYQYTPFLLGEDKYFMELWEDGLNFCIPWPTSGYGNYKLFINKHGAFNIGKNGTSNGTSIGLDVAGTIRVTGRFYYLPNGFSRSLSEQRSSREVYDKLLLLNGVKYAKSARQYEDYIPEGMTSEEFISKYGEIKYKTITDKNNEESVGHEEIGFIAQDFQKIFPDLVNKDSEGYLSIQYLGLLPLIIEALGEQNETLKNVVEATENLDKFLAVRNNFDYSICKNESAVTLTYYTKTPQDYELVIYNTNGVMVEKRSLNKSKDDLIINISSYKAGVYFFNILSNNEKIKSKSLII